MKIFCFSVMILQPYCNLYNVLHAIFLKNLLRKKLDMFFTFCVSAEIKLKIKKMNSKPATHRENFNIYISSNQII